MSRTTLRVRLAVLAASVLACLGIAAAPAAAASSTAGPASISSSPGVWQFAARAPGTSRLRGAKLTVIQRHNLEVQKVLREARRQKGKPYVYGADGPNGFDCSGFVRFVFLHAVGKSLPHNAAEQYHVLRHVRRSSLQIGDLVFVDNGGYISHVGIFDGHHHWWVAPHTGLRVERQRIYHAHFVYARVLVYDKVLTHKHKRKH